MTDTIEFGKRINHRPLIVSFIGSFLVGGLGLTVNIKIAIISFLAVLFLLKPLGKALARIAPHTVDR